MSRDHVSKHLLLSEVVIMLLSILSTYRPGLGQSISVSPNADTIYIVSGCTPPEIIFSLEREDDLFDSLTIKAGFNTMLGIGDSVEPAGVPGIVSLLVDKAGSHEYRLDFQGISSKDSYSIAPDSTCRINPAVFRMIFRIIRDGALIDSATWIAIVRQVPLGVGARDVGGGSTGAVVSSYPNPFNPGTTIRYSLPGRGETSIRIYDVVGREVGTLVDEMQGPGVYEVRFDGSRLSSGIYFIRMNHNGRVAASKMILMK